MVSLVLLAAVAVPLGVGAALMAGDRLGRPVGHTGAWAVAMLASVVTLAACVAAVVTDAHIDKPWVPGLGMRLHLATDGISAPLVILAAAVTLLAVAVSSRQRPKGTPGLFYGCLLVVLGGAVAAFSVHDAVAFFIAFEVVLVPMWVLIDRFGDAAADRRRAGWMFVLYTVGGSMFMLAGILLLVVSAGTSDLERLAGGAAAALPFPIAMTAGVLLTLGLAVKVPLIGVHSWLPRAHTAAPTAGSMLLAAVLLKLGTYGFIRLVVLPLPVAWRTIAPVIAVLAVVGIVVGGLVCLVERDLKRLVAWSSIAHMGFVMLALAAGQQIGLQAALYGNIAHGVISALLFAVVGALKARRGAVDVDEPMVGLRNSDPRLGFALVVGTAAAIGLPGLAGFWGEILALFAAWGAPHRPGALFHVLTAAAAFGAVLAAAYGVRVLRAVWAGERAPEAADATLGTSDGATPASTAGEHAEASASVATERVVGLEWLAIGVLVAAVFVLGLAPTLLMNVADADLPRLLGGLK